MCVYHEKEINNDGYSPLGVICVCICVYIGHIYIYINILLFMLLVICLERENDEASIKEGQRRWLRLVSSG